MLLNPGTLFGLGFGEWKFVAVNSTPPPSRYFATICKCLMPSHTFIADMPAGGFNVTRVDLEPKDFGNSEYRSIIWVGKCSACGVNYWTSDNMEWVRFLSDLQWTRMLAGAIPIATVESEGKWIKVEPTVIMFDEKGNKTRVMEKIVKPS